MRRVSFDPRPPGSVDEWTTWGGSPLTECVHGPAGAHANVGRRSYGEIPTDQAVVPAPGPYAAACSSSSSSAYHHTNLHCRVKGQCACRRAGAQGLAAGQVSDESDCPSHACRWHLWSLQLFWDASSISANSVWSIWLLQTKIWNHGMS
jgi:hypothetical protein